MLLQHQQLHEENLLTIFTQISLTQICVITLKKIGAHTQRCSKVGLAKWHKKLKLNTTGMNWNHRWLHPSVAEPQSNVWCQQQMFVCVYVFIPSFLLLIYMFNVEVSHLCHYHYSRRLSLHKSARPRREHAFTRVPLTCVNTRSRLFIGLTLLLLKAEECSLKCCTTVAACKHVASGGSKHTHRKDQWSLPGRLDCQVAIATAQMATDRLTFICSCLQRWWWVVNM